MVDLKVEVHLFHQEEDYQTEVTDRQVVSHLYQIRVDQQVLDHHVEEDHLFQGHHQRVFQIRLLRVVVVEGYQDHQGNQEGVLPSFPSFPSCLQVMCLQQRQL